MEEVARLMLSQLMEKQGGEKVPTEHIIELTTGKSSANAELCKVYAARTDKHSYIANVYVDGRVHVYVH